MLHGRGSGHCEAARVRKRPVCVSRASCARCRRVQQGKAEGAPRLRPASRRQASAVASAGETRLCDPLSGELARKTASCRGDSTGMESASSPAWCSKRCAVVGDWVRLGNLEAERRLGLAWRKREGAFARLGGGEPTLTLARTSLSEGSGSERTSGPGRSCAETYTLPVRLCSYRQDSGQTLGDFITLKHRSVDKLEAAPPVGPSGVPGSLTERARARSPWRNPLRGDSRAR